MLRRFIKNRTPLRSRLVLPLHNVRDDRFIRHFVAMMAFMVLTMLAISIFLLSLSNNWTTDVLASATLELPPAAVEDLPQIESLLKRTDGLESYTILNKEEVLSLVSPWFGKDSAQLANAISVPVLITIQFKKNSSPDLKKLLKQAQNISPNISISSHEDWLTPLAKLTDLIEFIAIGALFMLTAALMMAISGAAKGRVIAHKTVIDLLHVLGASDRFIFDQFQLYFLRLMLPGLLQGFALACLSVLIVWVWLDPASIPSIAPAVASLSWAWSLLIGLMVALALVCLLLIVARNAVKRALTLLDQGAQHHGA